MSARKACPRRATRRYLSRARHRAFMAELFGVCRVVDGYRVITLGATMTQAQLEQFTAALRELVVTADLAPAFAAPSPTPGRQP